MICYFLGFRINSWFYQNHFRRLLYALKADDILVATCWRSYFPLFGQCLFQLSFLLHIHIHLLEKKIFKFRFHAHSYSSSDSSPTRAVPIRTKVDIVPARAELAAAADVGDDAGAALLEPQLADRGTGNRAVPRCRSRHRR